MATRIGCDGLAYAIMTEEDTVEAAPTFATPVKMIGCMAIGVNPNSTMETLFADDGPMETATTLGKIEVEIKKNELTAAERAALLGHQVDSKGAIVYAADDVPPWVAIGFRTLKSNGNYRYVWLYKGRFADPEEQNETKGDGINFQTDTIKGQFVKLNNSYTIGGKTVRPWKYELDEDADDADSTTITGWYTAVPFPVPGA